MSKSGSNPGTNAVGVGMVLLAAALVIGYFVEVVL